MILEQSENKNSACGIFIDFAKAFDFVNHQILIIKVEHYGVRGIALKLFSSYFIKQVSIHCKQRGKYIFYATCYINWCSSRQCTWPLFISSLLNDLPNSCRSKMILYADDAVLLCADKNIQNLKIKS